MSRLESSPASCVANRQRNLNEAAIQTACAHGGGIRERAARRYDARVPYREK
jgi:hypothetical protein